METRGSHHLLQDGDVVTTVTTQSGNDLQFHRERNLPLFCVCLAHKLKTADNMSHYDLIKCCLGPNSDQSPTYILVKLHKYSTTLTNGTTSVWPINLFLWCYFINSVILLLLMFYLWEAVVNICSYCSWRPNQFNWRSTLYSSSAQQHFLFLLNVIGTVQQMGQGTCDVVSVLVTAVFHSNFNVIPS